MNFYPSVIFQAAIYSMNYGGESQSVDLSFDVVIFNTIQKNCDFSTILKKSDNT